MPWCYTFSIRWIIPWWFLSIDSFPFIFISRFSISENLHLAFNYCWLWSDLIFAKRLKLIPWIDVSLCQWSRTKTVQHTFHGFVSFIHKIFTLNRPHLTLLILLKFMKSIFPFPYFFYSQLALVSSILRTLDSLLRNKLILIYLNLINLNSSFWVVGNFNRNRVMLIFLRHLLSWKFKLIFYFYRFICF